MTTGSRETPTINQSSAGHALSEASWLDAHFEMCRPEYEAMVMSAGFQPGWKILDAGCGPGSYFPLLADIVGPAGAIHGIDIAPENIALAEQRVAGWGLNCPVELQVGSLLDLPYAGNQFDAVLCSATAQYFSDDDLARVLREFRRVVCPGGLVAVKDYDGRMERRPGDQATRWRLLAAISSEDSQRGTQIRGYLRTGLLKRWLERSGLEDVWQRTVPVERWAPLGSAEQAFLTSVLGGNIAASIATAEFLGLPESDIAYMRSQADPDSPEHALNDPELHYCETHVIAVGRVPSGSPD